MCNVFVKQIIKNLHLLYDMGVALRHACTDNINGILVAVKPPFGSQNPASNPW